MLAEFLFENRNKLLVDLFKIGDYLGRSLRENVEMFSLDSFSNKVSYISESDKVITASYNYNDNSLLLTDLKVKDAEIYKDDDKFNTNVGNSITKFINDIREDSLNKASTSFENVLNLWEDRLKFTKIKEKLDEKRENFDYKHNICRTDEFNKLNEIKPGLVRFLFENSEKVEKYSDLSSTIKLSNTVSKLFNCDKLSYDDLEKLDSFQVNEQEQRSVYELICRQELIKKELLESKHNFDMVWASNDKIRNLAGLIFEDKEKVVDYLAEAIREVPFLALVTKNQLIETITNCLNLDDSIKISEEQIKNYCSTLFNMKKPVKKALVEMLNEKYGVNIYNLKEIPSFKSLLNTQITIFESLAKISPKNSVQKEVLAETAKMLKNKTGIEAIEINSYIQEVFEKAGYKEFINEMNLMNYMDFDKMGSELGNVANILKMMKRVAAKGEMAARDPSMGGGMGGQMPGDLPSDAQYAPDAGAEDDDIGRPQMDPNQVPNVSPEDQESGKVPQDSVAPQNGMPPGDPAMDGPTPDAPITNPQDDVVPTDMPMDMDKGQLIQMTKELDDLLQNLKMELGAGDNMDGGMDYPDPNGEMPFQGDGIDQEQDALDGEEEDLEAQHGDLHNQEDDIEDEEADVKDKKKKLEKKEDSMKPKKDKEV